MTEMYPVLEDKFQEFCQARVYVRVCVTSVCLYRLGGPGRFAVRAPRLSSLLVLFLLLRSQ